MKFSDYQQRILSLSSETKGYGGFAAASSKRHIERAHQLRETMPEVSAFVAISAEEEAASAIFHALMKRKYDRSNELKPRDHRYKTGVYPFLKLIGESLSLLNSELRLRLYFDRELKENEHLRIMIPIRLANGSEYNIVPDPPLNLVSVDADGNSKDYLKEIRSIASEKGIDSIYQYIQKIANTRNRVLYASNSGIPKIDDIDGFLARHSEAVFLNLSMYLLIEPHRVQNFAQEVLGIFLDILQRIEDKET